MNELTSAEQYSPLISQLDYIYGVMNPSNKSNKPNANSMQKGDILRSILAARMVQFVYNIDGTTTKNIAMWGINQYAKKYNKLGRDSLLKTAAAFNYEIDMTGLRDVSQTLREYSAPKEPKMNLVMRDYQLLALTKDLLPRNNREIITEAKAHTLDSIRARHFNPHLLNAVEIIAAVTMRNMTQKENALRKLDLTLDEAINQLSEFGLSPRELQEIRLLRYDAYETYFQESNQPKKYDKAERKIAEVKNRCESAETVAMTLRDEIAMSETALNSDEAKQITKYEGEIGQLLEQFEQLDVTHLNRTAFLKQQTLAYFSIPLLAQHRRELLLELAQALNEKSPISLTRAHTEDSLMSTANFLITIGLVKKGSNVVLAALATDVYKVLKAAQIPVIIATVEEGRTTGQFYFFPKIFYDELSSYFRTDSQETAL